MNIDPDLVSGLLGAFNNFSEMELSGLGIDSINMGGLQWVYLNNISLNMLAVAGERKGAGNADLMRARLEVVMNAFINKFQITPEIMEGSAASYVKEFHEFDKDLDDLQDQWSMAESVTNAGELFDMLGVFQQVLNLFNLIIQNNCERETCVAIMDELKTYATKLDTYFDIQQYPEFQNISFDEQLGGWTVITLDPTKLRKDVLKKGLFAIIKHVKTVLINNLGMQWVIDAISKEILPYILSSWDLLEILDLIKPLVTILLERPEN